MALEIERKFKVAGEFKSLAKSSSHICQGYLCADGVRTVRVRLRDDKGYLTITGKSDAAEQIRVGKGNQRGRCA